MTQRFRIAGGALLIGLGLALAAEAAPTGPLDVDAAVRIALRSNFAHRQAEEGVSLASGSRLSSLARLLPSVSGSGTYTQSDQTSSLSITSVQGQPVPAFALPTDRKSTTTAFGVTVSENLSLPQWFGYRSAAAAQRAAEHARDASAQELAFAVRQQFYLVLRSKDLLQVQEEDLRLARDQERRTRTMFDLGSVARVDVLKAKVRVSEAEVALIQQRNAVAIESARLATLLGLSPDSRLELTGDLAATGAQVDSLGVLRESADRPDLERARADLSSFSLQHKAAVTSRLPSLFASFSFSTSTGDSESEQFQLDDSTGVPFSFNTASDSESDGWTFQVGASISLDAFLNAGDHRRTGAVRRQAEYALQGLELEVQREVEEAILNYRASLSAIQSAEDGVTSAEEDLRLSQERYQQGLGTVLELLESQVNLTRARNTLVNALTGLRIAEAALDKARGATLPN